MAENPGELERTLVRAVAELVDGRKFVKLVRAVELAARRLGKLTQEFEECLWDEQLDWRDDHLAFYHECAQIIRAGGCLEGQGNYGGVDVDPDEPELVEEYPPAHPKFLECRLTERGRAVADECE